MNMAQQDKLCQLYKKEYKRELIGDDVLSHFSSDFEPKTGHAIYANKKVLLGKKCYLMRMLVRKLDDKEKKIKKYNADTFVYIKGELRRMTSEEVIEANQNEIEIAKADPKKVSPKSVDGLTEELNEKYRKMSKEQIDAIIERDKDLPYYEQELHYEDVIKMKGIPKDAIKLEAKRRGIEVIDLYHLLYEGYVIAFDMTVGGKTVVMKKRSLTNFINLKTGERGTQRTITF